MRIGECGEKMAGAIHTRTRKTSSPRSILARQQDIAASMGFECAAASELEYYAYQESYEKVTDKHFAVCL